MLEEKLRQLIVAYPDTDISRTCQLAVMEIQRLKQENARLSHAIHDTAAFEG